jgi:hypothetical protein
MTNEAINGALELLRRSELRGWEVPAYNQIVEELQRELLINKGGAANEDSSEA